MKKIIVLFCISLMLLSCSNSDNSGGGIGPLIKRETVSTNGGVYTIDYFYNSNKLDHTVDSNGYTTNYIYQGNLIINSKRYLSGNLVKEIQYSYDNSQRCVNELSLDYQSNAGSKYTYTYNNDNTISFVLYNGDLNTQNNFYYGGKIHLNSIGDQISFEIYNPGYYSTLINSVYDYKNSPYKNILGYNKLPLMRYTYSYALSETAIDYTNTVAYSVNHAITYNSLNYAIHDVETVNQYNNGGGSPTVTSAILDYIYW